MDIRRVRKYFRKFNYKISLKTKDLVSKINEDSYSALKSMLSSFLFDYRHSYVQDNKDCTSETTTNVKCSNLSNDSPDPASDICKDSFEFNFYKIFDIKKDYNQTEFVEDVNSNFLLVNYDRVYYNLTSLFNDLVRVLVESQLLGNIALAKYRDLLSFVLDIEKDHTENDIIKYKCCLISKFLIENIFIRELIEFSKLQS